MSGKIIAKITIPFILLVLCLSLGGCGAPAKAGPEEETFPVEIHSNEVITKQNLSVGIETNEDGYYALMGDTEISFNSSGEISWICVHEPSLLSYKVSSEWNGGLYLLDLEEGEHLKSLIEEACDQLRSSGRDAAAKKLHTAISIIDESGPYTNAST